MKDDTKLLIGLGVGAALYGFVKSKVFTPGSIPREKLASQMLNGCVVGPLKEEILFRKVYNENLGAVMGDAWGPIASTAYFAGGHVPDKHPAHVKMAYFADAFVGGLVYSFAHELGGLPGSVAVHAAHNVGVNLGACGPKLAPVPVPVPGTALAPVRR